MINGGLNVNFNSKINSLIGNKGMQEKTQKPFSDVFKSKRETFNTPNSKEKFNIRELSSKNDFKKNQISAEKSQKFNVKETENFNKRDDSKLNDLQEDKVVDKEDKSMKVKENDDSTNLNEKNDFEIENQLFEEISMILKNDDFSAEEKEILINKLLESMKSLEALSETDKLELKNLFAEIVSITKGNEVDTKMINFENIEKLVSSLSEQLDLKDKAEFENVLKEIKAVINSLNFKEKEIEKQVDLKNNNGEEIKMIKKIQVLRKNESNESNESNENKEKLDNHDNIKVNLTAGEKEINDSNKFLKLEPSNEDKKEDSKDKVEIKGKDKTEKLFTKTDLTKNSSTMLKDDIQLDIKTEEVKTVVETSKITDVSKADRTILGQNIMDQIVKGTKMTFNVGKDMSEMVIKLNPKELGNVAVKISIHNETLMAEFNVESNIVKETLESNLEDLKNALHDKGFNIQGMDVSVNQDSKESFRQFEEMYKSTKGKKSYSKVTGMEYVDEKISKLQSLENTSSLIDAFA